MMLQKGVPMNITITPHNPIKDFFHKIASKIEDCIFTLFGRLPDRLIPAFVLNWMERYTDRRLTELKAQIIKSKWTAAEEQKILEQNRQQD